jgi:hypothetical protein
MANRQKGVCGGTHLWSGTNIDTYLTKFVKLLVESGTPVDTTTREGRTALDILCWQIMYCPDVRGLIRYLISCGAKFVDMQSIRYKPCRLLLQQVLSYDEAGTSTREILIELELTL